MWGAIAKIGGALLATLGLDYAVDSYNEYSTAQKEAALDSREAKWGKFILMGIAAIVGYKLLTKK